MRKLIVVAVILAFLLAYLATAILSVFRLAQAIDREDSSQILAMTDQVALRRSAVGQILQVGLEGRHLSNRDRIFAQTVGASMIDLFIEKLLTPNNLVELLKSGRIAATEAAPQLSINITRLSAQQPTDLFGRIRISGFRRFGLRLSNARAGDEHAELIFQFEPLSWQIVGLRLPKQELREQAEKFLKR
jgi:hypothetical protein